MTLLHRRELRIFYPDAASALAEGYTEFGEDDICPISGRVFRFAGFRLDQRELVMRARRLGGRPPELRLALHHLQQGRELEALGILDQADLVVAAMGYRPHALAVLDGSGAPVPLLAHTGPQQPLVDGHCQVLDAAGKPIVGLFGIGTRRRLPAARCAGRRAELPRAGERALGSGRTDVGALIVHAILRPVTPQFDPLPNLPGQTGKAPDWAGPAERAELAAVMVEQPGASFAGEGG